MAARYAHDMNISQHVCAIRHGTDIPLHLDVGNIWAYLGPPPRDIKGSFLHESHTQHWNIRRLYKGPSWKLPAQAPASWLAHTESRHPSPMRAKAPSKQPSGQDDMMIAFPCLQKSIFCVTGKEETCGGEGRSHMWESPSRSENKHSQPDAQTQSRCWDWKGNKKTQLVSYFFFPFFFHRSRSSQGGESVASTKPRQYCVLSRAE